MTDDILHLTDDETRVEAILRTMSADDLEREAPPDDLWTEIEAAVAAEHAVTATEYEFDDNVVDMTSRFRSRPSILVAAAAALLVLVGIFVTTSGSGGSNYEVVGGADLSWADGFVEGGMNATARASVLADGEAEAVRLDETALPPAPEGADLELWLIGVDSKGELTIQSIGVIADPTEGRVYEVPAEFDPASFDTVLVDISVEPRDGNAAHSGASIVRGPVVEA